MFHELSKSEKKLCRELIEKGLQQEYEKAIRDMDIVLGNWKNKKADNRQTYHALFKTLHRHNRHIAQRYDDVRGSRYLITVGAVLADGLITQEDIAGFKEESKQSLMRYLSLQQ